MPVFNRENTLATALTSVLSQVYKPLETIVVDDGSTDASFEIATQFPSVTVVRQQNSGPGSARNRGICEVGGEYIAFLDSDDVWFPWTLACYAKVIEEIQQPSFITGKHCLFTQEDELAKVSQGPVDYRRFENYFGSGEEWLWHGVSSFVIRRDAFIEAGGFTNRRVNGEDAELAMRLGQSQGFVHVSSPAMFGYRQHPGNITLDYEKSRDGLNLLIEGEQLQRYPGGPERANERAVIISRHVRPFAVTSARRGQFSDALRYYLAVWRECVRNNRWKFLLVLPWLAIFGWVMKKLGSSLTNRTCDE